MSSWEFPTDDPVELQMRLLSGSVTVTAAATRTATVTLIGNRPGATDQTGARVEFERGTLSVNVPEGSALGRHWSIDATIELPEGSSCLVDSVSADVRCTGRLAAVDIRTVSGDIDAEQVSGRAQVHTASGDVYVGQAGTAEAQSTSGDVSIGRVGDVTVRTASGDVGIDAATGRQVEVKSSSGDIGVRVPPGLGVYLDLSSVSGTVSSELDPAEESDGPQLTLECRTISGDVQVSRAAQPADRAGEQI
jgi:Putative adhesin